MFVVRNTAGPSRRFRVAVNGGSKEEEPIPWDIVFTPQQYMLHSSADSSLCSPAWWNIDVTRVASSNLESEALLHHNTLQAFQGGLQAFGSTQSV